MGRLRKRKGLLFVHKKKPENFCFLGRTGFTATGPEQQKFYSADQDLPETPVTDLMQRDLILRSGAGLSSAGGTGAATTRGREGGHDTVARGPDLHAALPGLLFTLAARDRDWGQLA
jgi:hypothetical protein